MPTVDSVVVELEVKGEAKKYIANLEAAEAAYTAHQQNILKKAGLGTPEFEKANKRRVDATNKAQKQIAQQQAKMLKIVKGANEDQASIVKKTTDKLKRSYQEQVDAQDKAGKSTLDFAAIVKRSLGPIAAGVSVVALANITKGSLEVAAGIAQSSNVAGVSAERFQELTFAADQYGVGQEKVSDILKDVNDRVSDFNTTGGGPLLDFFEQVAPKVGLAEDAFKGLSSDQALGLFVKSLEDAGASQADFTFFLESLSGDATALLPLLRDNGAELKTLSGRARDLGRVLDNDAVRSANDANIALSELGGTLKSNITSAVIEAAPEIEALTLNLIELTPKLIGWASAAVEGINDVTNGVSALKGILTGQGGLLGGDDSDANIAFDIAIDQSVIDDLAKEREKLESKLEKVLGGKNSRINAFRADRLSGKIDKINAKIKEAEARLKTVSTRFVDNADSPDTPNVTSNPNGGGLGGGGLKTVSEKDKAVQAQIQRQIEGIAKLGQSEKEQIADILALRLDAIDKSAVSESEKAELRMKAHDDEKRALAEIAAEEKGAAEREAEARFNISQDREDALARIEATTLRMTGRAVDALRVELEAVERRYEAELRLIDDLIAKRGGIPSPELLAQRETARANLSEAQENTGSLQGDVLSRIQGVSDGAQGSGSQLDFELDRIAEQEREKKAILEQFRSEDIELKRAYELELTQIEAEANELRKAARLNALDAELAGVQQNLGHITDAFKEGSKAQKIAARAEQAVAIGRIAVNTATGVSKALASDVPPVNFIKAALVGAAGAAQVAAAASQSFAKGGVNISGPGSTTSDSIRANLSRGESVITADGTRGNETGLRGLNAGLSPAEAFGLNIRVPPIDIPTPNVSFSVPQIASRGDISISSPFTVQGNVTPDAMPLLQAQIDNMRANLSRDVNKIVRDRDRRTTARHQRAYLGA